MMNRNEELEIAERLRHLPEMEMGRDDLEQMLEAELSKPKDEIDAKLVQQIVDLLEDTPTQTQQHESWNKIEKKLSFRRWRPVISGLARIAAVGVVLVALLLATYSTAQALNWEFLLRLMKPFAETFMVYSGDKPEPSPEPMTSEVYDDVVLTFTQAEFSTLADCPNRINGYPAKSVWMPERFVYLQGSMYADTLITSITHVYQSDVGICIIDISMFEDENKANTYHFEQLPAENTSMYIAGHQITFYHNSDNITLTASWMCDNIHYTITGSVSEEEITRIIDYMMK